MEYVYTKRTTSYGKYGLAGRSALNSLIKNYQISFVWKNFMELIFFQFLKGKIVFENLSVQWTPSVTVHGIPGTFFAPENLFRQR